MPILIAGAGIGGLTAALALLRAGFDVCVLEQASALGEVGAGVQISANGARVLQALGLRQELAAIGVQPEFREVRVWNSGLRQTQLALGNASFLRYGAPHYAVHRADLHAMLAEAVRRLKPAAIRLQARCTGFTQGPDGVRVTLANGETVAGSALIGADGIHSAIRAALFGADTARPSGCMAWRGLIRTSLLPEHVRRSINTNWIGEAAHIVTYPVREGTLLNMVGVIERHERQIESWSQRGTVEECLADFRGWHEDVQMLLGGIIEPFKWALMLRDPLPAWSIGRVSLLGDACHPTLPFLGQGAVMAIEDACVLARCLAANRADIPAALARYQQARIGRTTKLVQAASDNLARLHARALVEGGVAAAAHVREEFSETRVHDRFDWVYGYDAPGVDLP